MVFRSSQAAPSRLVARPDRPLATAIRIARRKAELTQSEVAALLRVKQSSVSQWERGVTEPTGERLLLLVAVLPSLADALKAQAGRLVTPAGGTAPPQ
jgi:DNA-binding transcriptional regulator YiaG